jgi:hypothetical protein
MPTDLMILGPSQDRFAGEFYAVVTHNGLVELPSDARAGT